MGRSSDNVHTRVGKYELGRVLGEGAFAKVRLATNVETGVKVAIKILDKDKVFKHQLVERIKREISTMKLVRHPNIVRLYEIMASKSKIYFVLEYVTGGELFNKIASQGKLKENEARKYFQQLISAVDYCHSRGVCHRDLKPENLLLDCSGNLKISDFGLSALPQQLREDGLLHTACGTPNYVAPEVIVHNGYNGAQADLWSCGIILYVLLTGVLPFDHSNIAILYKKIQRAELKFPAWFPSGARGLIAKILNPNPKLRVTIPNVLEDSWFKINYSPPKFIEDSGISLEDVNAVFDESKEVLMKEQQIIKPAFCNAFEIISLSKGLDLSGLFENQQDKKHGIYFASKHSAPDIIMKIEETAKPLGFSVKNRGDFKMKLQGVLGEFKGHLSVVTEIFAVAPSLFMVEVRAAGRDTLDSHNVNLPPFLSVLLCMKQKHAFAHPNTNSSRCCNLLIKAVQDKSRVDDRSCLHKLRNYMHERKLTVINMKNNVIL